MGSRVNNKKGALPLLISVLPVLLDVVEAQSEDFEDDFIQNFHPVFFFVFSFHFQS